jgi:hypothetical protein
MTVGELKKLLDNYPDHLSVDMVIEDDDDYLISAVYRIFRCDNSVRLKNRYPYEFTHEI